MEYIYIILENSQPYGLAYKSYAKAVHSVKQRHANILTSTPHGEHGQQSPHTVDVPENPNGITRLYIHRDVYIYIYRLPLIPLA